MLYKKNTKDQITLVKKLLVYCEIDQQPIIKILRYPLVCVY